MLRTAASLVALCGVGLSLQACVTRERDAVRAAREAYDTCIEEHPDDRGDCSLERMRYEAEAERYREKSQRAWSCDLAQSDCPTPR